MKAVLAIAALAVIGRPAFEFGFGPCSPQTMMMRMVGRIIVGDEFAGRICFHRHEISVEGLTPVGEEGFDGW